MSPPRAPSSATAASTRTPATASAATGSRPPSLLVQVRAEEPQHAHEVVGVDHRCVDRERRHAPPREQHLPAALAGPPVHLDPRVLARHVEDEATALLGHLELTLVDLELGDAGA